MQDLRVSLYNRRVYWKQFFDTLKEANKSGNDHQTITYDGRQFATKGGIHVFPFPEKDTMGSFSSEPDPHARTQAWAVVNTDSPGLEPYIIYAKPGEVPKFGAPKSMTIKTSVNSSHRLHEQQQQQPRQYARSEAVTSSNFIPIDNGTNDKDDFNVDTKEDDDDEEDESQSDAAETDAFKVYYASHQTSRQTTPRSSIVTRGHTGKANNNAHITASARNAKRIGMKSKGNRDR